MSVYQNTNAFIVIAEDNRDPDQSWQAHLDRGSAGGVDCVAPMRTRLLAPMDCHVSSYWGGTGGNTIHMDAADGSGWSDEFMHADSAPVTGFVPIGGFVGYSGASGGDYAPHVHWHRIAPAGNRANPWHYFTSGPASGGASPLIRRTREDTMQLAHIPKGASNGKDALFLLFGEKFYLEFTGQEAANALSVQIGGNSAPVSRSFFDAVARAQGIANPVDVVNIADAG